MSDPARDLRYARWLLERAQPAIESMPQCAEAALRVLDLLRARELLGQLAGDYRPDEEKLFAQLQAVSDSQLDLWAEMKASDR